MNQLFYGDNLNCPLHDECANGLDNGNQIRTFELDAALNDPTAIILLRASTVRPFVSLR